MGSMDSLSSNSVKALGFCLSTATIKSRVHFFPFAGVTSGPYTIVCTLTLFGKGVERRSVMLDGGRLGQPDGVRLEDAFPSLRGEASGLFGLEVKLSCPQGRVNLLTSQAAIELVSSQSSTLYSLSRFVSAEEEVEAATEDTSPEDELPYTSASGSLAPIGVGVQESLLASSLIMINASKDALKPELVRVSGEHQLPLHVGILAAESVIEVPLDESLFKDSRAHECIWGLLRAEKVSLGSRTHENQTGYYLMYRDPETKQPISAVAL